MHFHSLVLLSFAASVLGYVIITPNKSYGWTNMGLQNATWQLNGSDPLNFTAVLSNKDSNFYPNQVLAALVVGSTLSANFSPPSETWPVGDGFRLTFVKDTNDLGTVYAQSEEFSIELPSQNSSSTSGTPAPFTATVATTPNQVGTPIAQTTASQVTGTSNSARPSNDVHAVLMSGFGLVGLVLALV